MTSQYEKEKFMSVEEIRKRARENIESGPITPEYKADRERVLQLLKEALATEWVYTLRYMHHYYTADGIQAQSVAQEFLEHAKEEQEHADQIARRIKQLGGNPSLNPDELLRNSHAEYQEGDTLVKMIQEDLVGERIAIESYSQMVRYLGNDDPTTRRMMEEILAKEEEHADELASLLQTLDPRKAHQPLAA